MSNLIKFEFKRIFQSVFFWIVTAFSVVWPILTALVYRVILSLTFDFDNGMSFKDLNLPQSMLTALTWLIAASFITELPKLVALFTCLHIGRDYTDGIIRNKITAGHSRGSIYFSYMITQLCASVFFCVVYICCGLLGLAISGFGVDLNGGEIFGRFAVSIIVFLVMTVLFVVLSLIFRRRAAPIIFCILIALMSNGVSAVIGLYNTSPKAADIYLEQRHSYFVEMIKEGYTDKDTVKLLEKEYRKSKLLGMGFGWQLFYPVYAITPLGYEGDYQIGGFTTMSIASGDYKQEIDYASDLMQKDGSLYDINPIYDWYLDEPSGDMPVFSLEQFDDEPAMHMSYSKLNWIYTGKSLVWIAVIGAWGFTVFRKKNLF